MNDITLQVDDENQISVPMHELSAHLAGEVAARLSPVSTILERYGISQEQWGVIKKDPVFRGMVKEKLTEFQGDLNTLSRVKLKSGMALEDSILEVYKMVHDATVPASARMEGVKILRQLAGADIKEEGASAGGERFAININIGTPDQAVTIEGSASTRIFDD